MDENNFRKQILDDLNLIKEQYKDINNRVLNDAYAFNFWILSRLYNMDEEIVFSHITEGNDKSIDCYVHFEDTKELFILQNKFYDINTPINRKDVSDFLQIPLSVLMKGNYNRSDELQKIFNKAYSDPEYKIWFHFYVSNNKENKDVNDLIANFETNDSSIKAYIGAKIFYLKDIQDLYYGERFNSKKTFTAILPTYNKATSLDIRPKDYNLTWMIAARYVMVNIIELFKMYREALKENYEIFDENIREYLGKNSINNKIINTLKSKEDRENFFFYNNGITMTCNKCDTLDSNSLPSIYKNRYQYGFKLKNPQIVNGCQTINSIFEVLSHYSDDILENEFNKCFVLVKVFVFDEKTCKEKPDLESNIVKYTNSQNAINEKAFASKKKIFLNLQNEFEKRGLLLLVKQSDKNTFSINYKDDIKLKNLKKKSENIRSFFDLEFEKANDLMIPIEKLIQVLLAFYKDGYYAFTKKDHVLRQNSELYNDFSVNIEKYFTIDNMIRIFLTYKKAEQDQKQSQDKRTPIPYYLVGFMGYKYKDKSQDYESYNSSLDELFSNKNNFLCIYNFYNKLTGYYSEEYFKDKKADYNKMIKQEIDYGILNNSVRMMVKFMYKDPILDNYFKEYK